MNRLSSWCVGLATLLLLSVACCWEYYPPIAGPQRLSLSLPAVLPVGTGEPLIVTGAPAAADYFFLRYVDDRTVVLAYDSWGHGGPTSAPIRVVPGGRHTLEVQLPSLGAIPYSVDQPSDLLRVSVDGIVVLDSHVAFHSRRPLRAYFARNPLGGTSCGPEFHGQLYHAGGRPLVGDARSYFTLTARFRAWLWFGRWQVLASSLIAAAAAWLFHRLTTAQSLRHSIRLLPQLRRHRTFLITATFCCASFCAVLTSGSFRLIYPEVFGNFYDFQALSLLQGRLDVPEGSLQGEAFIYDGKVFGYFGITPALLRLPFVVFGLAFGELSRAAMLLFFAATLAGAYLVQLDATRLLRPNHPQPARWQTILFTLHLGLGSTMFFLGSRAYIYHEAILCGLMFAVFSCWCSLRHFSQPAGRWWLGALVLGLFSVHARPPTGLFALTVLGCVVATHLLRSIEKNATSRETFRSCAIGVGAVLGVLSFNALSYAKFRTFEGCPLRLNVQYSPTRLAKIDSKQFHPTNLPYGLTAYLLRPTFDFSARFPWVYLAPPIPPTEFAAAKLDLPDRTAALPYGMTGLFLLASVGCVSAYRNSPAARAPVLILWIAAVPFTLAMAAAIATAERYTGDWVPFLVCAGAFGLAAPSWKPLATATLATATLWACLLTFALTLHFQGAMVWGVSDHVKQNYQQLRDHVDGFFTGHRPPSP